MLKRPVLLLLLLPSWCVPVCVCSKVYKSVVRGQQHLIAKVTHASPLQVRATLELAWLNPKPDPATKVLGVGWAELQRGSFIHTSLSCPCQSRSVGFRVPPKLPPTLPTLLSL